MPILSAFHDIHDSSHQDLSSAQEPHTSGYFALKQVPAQHVGSSSESEDYVQALQSADSLGQEYLLNEAGQVTPVTASTGSSGQTTSTTSTQLSAPPPTLVGTPGGFQIKLIWDPSVASAPVGFMQAVIDAAQYYTSLFTNKEVVNIDVGYGEIAGSSMSPSALGESESYGYLTSYSTVTNALMKDGFTFAASNEPKSAQFFITSAEAKTLGLTNPTSTALDGYIGFSNLSGTGYSWNFAATVTGANTGTGPSQFDLQSVALHEISEVLGRIGMEGAVINGKATYTPLDLFDFKSAKTLALSPTGGYFSNNNGATNFGFFNNAALYGGDVSDWASALSALQAKTQGLPIGSNVMDAFAAFDYPGYNGDISKSDVLVMAALGYKLKSGVA